MTLAPRIGNRHLETLLRARLLQAKLTVSYPQDVFEQEADRVADQVMRMPDSAAHVDPHSAALVQRKCHECEEELNRSPVVQRSEETAAVPTVDAATEHSINALSGRGRALPRSVRSFMESRFHADFRAVQVHTDANAHELARAVSARAFTIGRNIVFAAGHFAPETDMGKRLLAHELTHVIQQGAAPQRSPRTNRAPFSVAETSLQRAPRTQPSKSELREQQLEELASDPGEAHGEWPRLSPTERNAVVEKMRRRFGRPFADEFLALANAGAGQPLTITWQLGLGPTPRRLLALGYRRGGPENFGDSTIELEVWVHPTGKTIRREISRVATKTPKESLTDAQSDALYLLRELREANNRLEKLCNPKPENQEDKVIVLHGRAIQVHEEFIPPIDESEAEDAMNEFDSTLDQLRDLQGDVDMSAVDPNFWGKVDAEEERNGRVRESCCETHRGDRVLDCESILGPITP